MKLSQNFFVNNRKELKKLVGGRLPVVLPADVLIQQYSDRSFSFRQNSNFYYLTGINEAALTLVLDHDGDYLIMPPLAKYLEIESGKIDLDSLRHRSGIDKFFENNEGWRTLKERLAKSRAASTLPVPPKYIKDFGFYTNPTRGLLIKKLKSLSPGIELNDISGHLIALRSVKQEEELKAIQSAIDITITAFEKTKRDLKTLTNEFEIDSLFYEKYKKAEVSNAFGTIAATGRNACAIHYDRNNSKLNKSELIVVDAGAEVEHYSADISRTYCLEPSDRQRAIYDSVKDVQSYAMSILKPGLVFMEYEDKVTDFMAMKLNELKLIKGTHKDDIRRYFPHLTSHSLGLDTHDIWLRDMVIKPNMVLTVEPGIYIPEEDIGVRLEDDILITKGGAKNISGQLASLIN